MCYRISTSSTEVLKVLLPYVLGVGALPKVMLITTQVGNEFSQVEGLWSQFENVMAKEPEDQSAKDSKEGAADEQAQS